MMTYAVSTKDSFQHTGQMCVFRAHLDKQVNGIINS